MVTTGTRDIQQEPWYDRLFLPTYRINEAARYAGAHPNTVAAWHRGTNPLLSDLERREGLSYLQLVEVAFVSFFRQQRISMHKIREARRYLSEDLRCDFPFSRFQFKTEGMNILMEHHKALGPSNVDQLVVANRRGQLAWADFLGNKFMEFEYDYEMALRWHPAGPESQVTIDPRFRFGRPMVQGLETWAIRGRHEAGESIEEISEDFAVTYQGVIDALRFEGIPEATLV